MHILNLKTITSIGCTKKRREYLHLQKDAADTDIVAALRCILVRVPWLGIGTGPAEPI